MMNARRGLRLRPGRTIASALGIALAAAMLAASLVVSDGLGRGFQRSVRAAGLADMIVRFTPAPASEVAQRIQALPDIAGFSLRQEVTGVSLSTGDQVSDSASVQVVWPGRRGYAVVAGHDLSPNRAGAVVVERGLASAWGIRLGAMLNIGGLGSLRVIGFSQAPDNVSYPLAVPRVYVSEATVAARYGADPNPSVNLAQIWLRDPRYLDQVLVQARATSYGLRGLRFVTQSGVRVLLDQAAGIVIDLLVALSLIALVTAAVMLAASARAEVQRRLTSIGVRRAIGASRAHLAGSGALEALLVAAPAATLGVIAGALATSGPTASLLTLLNEPPPGAGLLAPLVLVWLVSVAIPVAGAAWPAWRAAGRPPVALLGGAELAARRERRRRRRFLSWTFPGVALAGLGARLVGARRARWVATATALGASTAFVLLMLALASALTALETDPSELGRRYQLTATLAPSAAGWVRTIPGVQAVAPRYEEQAVDSFSLGQTIDVIAYPGDHTRFEAPPLAAGTRLRGLRQAEVGVGLADALGLTPGSPLAIQLADGVELRLQVSGLVSSLDDDGRVAYLPAATLLAADPSAPEQLAIVARPGADLTAITQRLGSGAAPASTATGRGVPLVQTLRSILRAVAIVDGLVCVYALIQACALTVQERRRTISVLRAVGAGGPAVRRLLAGAVAALVVPAAVLGIALERLVLGPVVSGLAANYATLPLAAGPRSVLAVVAGLVVAGTVAVVWVAHQATREAVVKGLAAT